MKLTNQSDDLRIETIFSSRKCCMMETFEVSVRSRPLGRWVRLMHQQVFKILQLFDTPTNDNRCTFLPLGIIKVLFFLVYFAGNVGLNDSTVNTTRPKENNTWTCLLTQYWCST